MIISRHIITYIVLIANQMFQLFSNQRSVIIRSIVILIVFCCQSLTAMSEIRIKGRVTDENGTPIPYATISIPTRDRGTLTDSAGVFNAGFGSVLPTDTIRFSSIGYEPRATTAKDINSADGTYTIILKSKPYQLHEVSVIPPKTKKKTFGRTSMGGSFEVQIGSEHSEGCGPAVHCKVKKRAWITSVSMGWIQRKGTVEKMPFRLNIYNKKDGRWVNVTQRSVTFTYRKEDLNEEGRFVYKLPEPMMFSGDTMVEFEFLEPMKGRTIYIKSNIMAGHFIWHENNKWESIPTGTSFAVEAIVEK